MRTAIMLLMVWGAAAWAAEPGADGPVPAPDEIKAPDEVAAPSNANSPNEVDASSDPPAAEQPKTEAAANDEFRPPSGYTKKTRGDKTYYCRRETPVGTRFATDYCYTQEQLQRITKSGQSMRDDVARRQTQCAGSACMGD